MDYNIAAVGRYNGVYFYSSDPMHSNHAKYSAQACLQSSDMLGRTQYQTI